MPVAGAHARLSGDAVCLWLLMRCHTAAAPFVHSTARLYSTDHILNCTAGGGTSLCNA
jgi:hypothetical protein